MTELKFGDGSVDCIWYRDWPPAQPRHCICNWHRCKPEGCRDYAQIKPLPKTVKEVKED